MPVVAVKIMLYEIVLSPVFSQICAGTIEKLGGSESDDLQKIIIQINESERMPRIPQY